MLRLAISQRGGVALAQLQYDTLPSSKEKLLWNEMFMLRAGGRLFLPTSLPSLVKALHFLNWYTLMSYLEPSFMVSWN